MPDWLLPRLAARFGPATQAELQALLEPAPLDLRVNLLKATRAEARAALAAEGLHATPTRFSPWGLRLASRRSVTAGTAFQSGLVEIQDEGSQLVAALVDARPGHRVCDYLRRRRRQDAGARRRRWRTAATCSPATPPLPGWTTPPAVCVALGVGNAERHLLLPGDKWAKRRAGTLRSRFGGCALHRHRHLAPQPRCAATPDRAADLAELTARQAAILDAAAPLVRKHGRLVYATCALLDEENEAQVMSFLARHPGFSLVPLARAWPPDGPPPCEGDFLALTPARHGTDGFFAAVLERIA